jgi:exodeoxyribonuclease VII small subunit
MGYALLLSQFLCNMKKKSEQNEGLTYASAWSELQEILQDIQRESIDFEAVSQKVARANELIAFCRGRLQQTEAEMNQLIYGHR